MLGFKNLGKVMPSNMQLDVYLQDLGQLGHSLRPQSCVILSVGRLFTEARQVQRNSLSNLMATNCTRYNIILDQPSKYRSLYQYYRRESPLVAIDGSLRRTAKSTRANAYTFF